MIQTARLRRAWTAICTYYQQAEQDRSKVQASDLDTLLDETELRDSKTAFWRRYRQRFPPEIHPADSTISRVSREMSKRMLCIFNVWKVKTLQHQLLTSQKKRKLGENLFTEEAEEEPTCEHTVEAYLDRLHTLLIAYAMAGVASPKSSDPAFDAKNEATLGADSTLYALVPLDLCMQYFFRAKKTVMALPASKRLAWLSTRDAEERAEWTSRFRESTASLGAIMKEVFVARDAHWMQAGHPEMPMPSSPATAASSGTPRSPSKLQLGKPINGRKVAKVMKDGTIVPGIPAQQLQGQGEMPQWCPQVRPRGSQ